MTNKEIVIQGLTKLFIERDVAILDKLWAKDYIQHNPLFGSGRDVLKGLAESLDDDFRYEMGAVLAEGDLVFVNGRYTGLTENPMVALDAFRVVNGKITEHWDILQEEITDTKSGNPMFPIQ